MLEGRATALPAISRVGGEVGGGPVSHERMSRQMVDWMTCWEDAFQWENKDTAFVAG